MKNLIKLPAIVLGLLLLITGTTQSVKAQDEDISLQSFYDELSPYGTWIQDPQYGYVWRPDVEQGDFRPYYSNGRWAMTEYGNTWVSNYDWGWAPFHYGRWVYNSYRQWIWIPDTVWGPAWVSWRSGGGYYGWAPLGPGINVNINFGIPDSWWVFIPQRNIYYDSFPRYYSRRNVTIIHNTTIINNTYERNRRTYYTGPRIDEVRRVTNRDVAIYNINRTGRPGRSEISGRDVNIYNPRNTGRADRGNVQAPRSVVQGDAGSTRINRSSRGSTGTDNNPGSNNIPSRGTARPGRTAEGTPTGTSEGRGQGQYRPGMERSRGNGTTSTRPERTAPQTQPQNVQPPARQEQPQRQAQPQRQQTQPERPQAQPQREQQRAEPPVRQQQPQQQRQEQPQRPQRTEHVQPAQPSRSSEGRSSGGSRTESSRPSGRSGRG